MANHPFNEAFLATPEAAADTIAQAIETNTPLLVSSVAEITTRNLDRTVAIHLVSGSVITVYRYDPEETGDHDGVTIIHDTNDRAFVFAGVIGVTADGLFNAYGDTSAAPSDRDQYDAQAERFTFFATNEDSGQGAWYVRATSVPGTWIGPFPFRGPAGVSSIGGTSATSLTIGAGEKVFTTQEGVGWLVGSRLRAASAADPAANYMEGVVGGYSGTTLTLTVDNTKGAGTFADWSIGLAGDVGAAGADLGIPARFNDGITDVDPGSGHWGVNVADLTAATELYISETDANGAAIAAELAAWDDSTSVNSKGIIELRKRDDARIFVRYRITSTITDQGVYDRFTIAHLSSGGALTDEDVCQVFFTPTGDKGDDGVGAGDVLGPAGATNEAVARFDTATGKLLQDSAVGIDDAGNMTGVNNLATAGTVSHGGIVKWSKGANVASVAALVLGDDGNSFDITGTTAITSIATKGVGTVVRLQFAGVLTLTHSATDLILPGAANITTAAGDVAEFEEYAAGDWRCTNYSRADGRPLVGGGVFTEEYISPEQVITSGGTLTLAHGLSSASKLFQAFLVNKTTEANYAVGDEPTTFAGSTDANFNTGVSIVADGTNINVRYGSGANVFVLLDKTTGSPTFLTNTSWRFKLIAWA